MEYQEILEIEKDHLLRYIGSIIDVIDIKIERIKAIVEHGLGKILDSQILFSKMESIQLLDLR